MKIPIDQIVVGNRRREDMGDIQGLADSIATYGLLHPVVVDEHNRLVAGGRRLEACRSLGWQQIEARSIGELTDKDLRTIELEENLRRKDLTEIEKSRNMVALAEIKAEEIRTPCVQNPVRELLPPSGKNLGGRPERPDSQQKVAEAIGVPRQTLVEARQHVAAIEKYPILETLPKKQAIKTAREIDKLPEEKRASSYSAEIQRLDREYKMATQVNKIVETVLFFSEEGVKEAARCFLQRSNEPDRADWIILSLDSCVLRLQQLKAEFVKSKTLRVVK